MLKYNQEMDLDIDVSSYGSYYTTMYEHYSPENPNIYVLDTWMDKNLFNQDKKMRRIWKKHNDLCRTLEQR
tara:strand:- start:296 stop:508 length:213 start_codon:yes stop_codon:yes gene_type:complete